ncbi:MAG: hypothetical protein K2J62_05280 [Bacteroidales bacterium]|nr:hypothetical protein [Bacteroidales bacterium]
MTCKEQQSFITELKALSRALRSSWGIDKSTLEIIGTRHQLFEKTIIQLIPQEVLEAPESGIPLLTTPATRKEFMHLVQESFRVNNPGIMSHLESSGLNSAEIDYCILLTLGFRGCEIGFLTSDRSHYNKSTAIRHKLGLAARDTNLGNHLRNLKDQKTHKI